MRFIFYRKLGRKGSNKASCCTPKTSRLTDIASASQGSVICGLDQNSVDVLILLEDETVTEAELQQRV